MKHFFFGSLLILLLLSGTLSYTQHRAGPPATLYHSLQNYHDTYQPQIRRLTDAKKYELGLSQFLLSLEHLSQSLYIYAPESLPWEVWEHLTNEPALISYKEFRDILQRLYQDLRLADRTLSLIKEPDVKLRFYPGRIKIDIDQDKQYADWEYVASIFPNLAGDFDYFEERDLRTDTVTNFYVTLDIADVYWLRGYCHLIQHFLDFFLAYEWEAQFSEIAHDLDMITPEKEFTSRQEKIILLKHPGRMKSAYKHILEVIRLSRMNWTSIQNETDDDHEWLPSPVQTGPFPGVSVNEDMITAWMLFLDELEAIITGKKLIPLNREDMISVYKIYHKPRTIDLDIILDDDFFKPWIGKGPAADIDKMDNVQDPFDGRLGGFALWFN